MLTKTWFFLCGRISHFSLEKEDLRHFPQTNENSLGPAYK